MQVREIHSVLRGKVEKAKLNIEERKQGLCAEEVKVWPKRHKGKILGAEGQRKKKL